MSVSNMESLLDFEKPLDVGLLDVVVTGFYTCSNETERAEIGKFMKRMQEHPTMWQRVDAILETSQNQQTRFFALQLSP